MLGQVKTRLKSTLLPAREVIGEPGQAIERVYFPTSGVLSAQVLLETGRCMETALVGYTGASGLMAAFGFNPAVTHQVCLIEAHAWTIQVSDLREMLRSVPYLEEQLKPFLFRQVSYAGRVGVCNAAHTADQRVARWLLIAMQLLRNPEMRLAQEELSAVLGLQRTAVNPSLRKLKAERLIDTSRGRITVINPRALRQRACECYGPLHEWILGNADVDGVGYAP